MRGRIFNRLGEPVEIRLREGGGAEGCNTRITYRVPLKGSIRVTIRDR